MAQAYKVFHGEGSQVREPNSSFAGLFPVYRVSVTSDWAAITAGSAYITANAGTVMLVSIYSATALPALFYQTSATKVAYVSFSGEI